MDAEVILDIALGSLLAAAHASVIATSVIWRRRKYRKGLHYSTIGFASLFLSLFIGAFLPIGGFTFLDGGKSGTKALIAALVICPLLLASAVRGICYCICIEGTEVVKKTLLHEVRIDLRDEGTTIDDRKPWTKTFWISINSGKNTTIRFKSRGTEGDINSFLDNCKKMQNPK